MWWVSLQLVREAQQLVREAQQLVREAQQLVREAQQLVREAQQLVRETQQLVREAQQLVREAHIGTQIRHPNPEFRVQVSSSSTASSSHESGTQTTGLVYKWASSLRLTSSSSSWACRTRKTARVLKRCLHRVPVQESTSSARAPRATQRLLVGLPPVKSLTDSQQTRSGQTAVKIHQHRQYDTIITPSPRELSRCCAFIIKLP